MFTALDESRGKIRFSFCYRKSAVTWSVKHGMFTEQHLTRFTIFQRKNTGSLTHTTAPNPPPHTEADSKTALDFLFHISLQTQPVAVSSWSHNTNTAEVIGQNSCHFSLHSWVDVVIMCEVFYVSNWQAAFHKVYPLQFFFTFFICLLFVIFILSPGCQFMETNWHGNKWNSYQVEIRWHFFSVLLVCHNNLSEFKYLHVGLVLVNTDIFPSLTNLIKF